MEEYRDVDICVTCISDKPPQLPLREELHSLGVEVVYRARGTGVKAAKKETEKALEEYRSNSAKKEKNRCIPSLPLSPKRKKAKREKRKRKERDLRSLKSLSYEEYVDYLRQSENNRKRRDSSRSSSAHDRRLSDVILASRSGDTVATVETDMEIQPSDTAKVQSAISAATNAFASIPAFDTFSDDESDSSQGHATADKASSTANVEEVDKENAVSEAFAVFVAESVLSEIGDSWNEEPVTTVKTEEMPIQELSGREEEFSVDTATDNTEKSSKSKASRRPVTPENAHTLFSAAALPRESPALVNSSSAVSDGSNNLSSVVTSPVLTTTRVFETSNKRSREDNGATSAATETGNFPTAALSIAPVLSAIHAFQNSNNAREEGDEDKVVSAQFGNTTNIKAPVSLFPDLLSSTAAPIDANDGIVDSDGIRSNASAVAQKDQATSSANDEQGWVASALQSLSSTFYGTASNPEESEGTLLSDRTIVLPSALFSAIANKNTNNQDIKRFLSTNPAIAKSRLDNNGRLALHVACDKELPEPQVNENSLEKCQNDVASRLELVRTIVNCNEDACMITDALGDLPVQLLARRFMLWEDRFAMNLHEQQLLRESDSEIKSIFEIMSICMEIVIKPVVSLRPLCRARGSVGLMLPLHIATWFDVSNRTLELLVAEYPEAAGVPSNLQLQYFGKLNSALPIELLERQRCFDQTSPNENLETVKSSDLIFSYNPNVLPFRRDHDRIERIEKMIMTNAETAHNDGNEMSIVAKNLWCWFCTFDDGLDNNDNYVESVKRIAHSLESNVVRDLAMVERGDGCLLLDIALPECVEILKHRISLGMLQSLSSQILSSSSKTASLENTINGGSREEASDGSILRAVSSGLPESSEIQHQSTYNEAPGPSNDTAARFIDENGFDVASGERGEAAVSSADLVDEMSEYDGAAKEKLIQSKTPSVTTDSPASAVPDRTSYEDKHTGVTAVQSRSSSLAEVDERTTPREKMDLGEMCKEFFNVKEESFPTTFVIMPYKLKIGPNGAPTLQSPENAKVALNFAICLKQMTEPWNVYHVLEKKSIDHLGHIVSSQNMSDWKEHEKEYEKLERMLLTFYKINLGYLYFLDESTGVPVVESTSTGGSDYPIEMNDAVDSIKRLLPLMLMGMIRMRGERAIAVLAKTIMQESADESPNSWNQLAKEIVFSFQSKEKKSDESVSSSTSELATLTEELIDYLSRAGSSARARRPESKTGCEWIVELSFLKSILERVDPMGIFAGLNPAKGKRRTALWSLNVQEITTSKIVGKREETNKEAVGKHSETYSLSSSSSSSSSGDESSESADSTGAAMDIDDVDAADIKEMDADTSTTLSGSGRLPVVEEAMNEDESQDDRASKGSDFPELVEDVTVDRDTENATSHSDTTASKTTIVLENESYLRESLFSEVKENFPVGVVSSRSESSSQHTDSVSRVSQEKKPNVSLASYLESNSSNLEARRKSSRNKGLGVKVAEPSLSDNNTSEESHASLAETLVSSDMEMQSNAEKVRAKEKKVPVSNLTTDDSAPTTQDNVDEESSSSEPLPRDSAYGNDLNQVSSRSSDGSPDSLSILNRAMANFYRSSDSSNQSISDTEPQHESVSVEPKSRNPKLSEEAKESYGGLETTDEWSYESFPPRAGKAGDQSSDDGDVVSSLRSSSSDSSQARSRDFEHNDLVILSRSNSSESDHDLVIRSRSKSTDEIIGCISSSSSIGEDEDAIAVSASSSTGGEGCSSGDMINEKSVLASDMTSTEISSPGKKAVNFDSSTTESDPALSAPQRALQEVSRSIFSKSNNAEKETMLLQDPIVLSRSNSSEDRGQSSDESISDVNNVVESSPAAEEATGFDNSRPKRPPIPETDRRTVFEATPKRTTQDLVDKSRQQKETPTTSTEETLQVSEEPASEDSKMSDLKEEGSVEVHSSAEQNDAVQNVAQSIFSKENDNELLLPVLEKETSNAAGDDRLDKAVDNRHQEVIQSPSEHDPAVKDMNTLGTALSSFEMESDDSLSVSSDEREPTYQEQYGLVWSSDEESSVYSEASSASLTSKTSQSHNAFPNVEAEGVAQSEEQVGETRAVFERKGSPSVEQTMGVSELGAIDGSDGRCSPASELSSASHLENTVLELDHDKKEQSESFDEIDDYCTGEEDQGSFISASRSPTVIHSNSPRRRILESEGESSTVELGNYYVERHVNDRRMDSPPSSTMADVDESLQTNDETLSPAVREGSKNDDAGSKPVLSETTETLAETSTSNALGALLDNSSTSETTKLANSTDGTFDSDKATLELPSTLQSMEPDEPHSSHNRTISHDSSSYINLSTFMQRDRDTAESQSSIECQGGVQTDTSYSGNMGDDDGSSSRDRRPYLPSTLSLGWTSQSDAYTSDSRADTHYSMSTDRTSYETSDALLLSPMVTTSGSSGSSFCGESMTETGYGRDWQVDKIDKSLLMGSEEGTETICRSDQSKPADTTASSSVEYIEEAIYSQDSTDSTGTLMERICNLEEKLSRRQMDVQSLKLDVRVFELMAYSFDESRDESQRQQKDIEHRGAHARRDLSPE